MGLRGRMEGVLPQAMFAARSSLPSSLPSIDDFPEFLALLAADRQTIWGSRGVFEHLEDFMKCRATRFSIYLSIYLRRVFGIFFVCYTG